MRNGIGAAWRLAAAHQDLVTRTPAGENHPTVELNGTPLIRDNNRIRPPALYFSKPGGVEVHRDLAPR